MEPTKICLLSPEVVHRIAAGEVVEAPSSVIKELIENAIDAGANKVIVKIVEGGFDLIEVNDNGSGMSEADLLACCQRHATSKISKLDDLENISSLGFRGEALAALSAISQLEILSRTKHEPLGWKLSRTGTDFRTEPAAHDIGTTVRIFKIFFNTPARLKFLRSKNSEANRCIKSFLETAIAHPAVELTFYALTKNGEVDSDFHFLQEDKQSRVRGILNAATSTFISSTRDHPVPGLNHLELHIQNVPEVAKNTKDIFFIVNGRCIEDKRIPFVLREAFGGMIEIGTYPRGAVYAEVDNEFVDVNVHPQKKEVRWAKDFPINGVIFESVRSELDKIGKVKRTSENFTQQTAATITTGFDFNTSYEYPASSRELMNQFRLKKK